MQHHDVKNSENVRQYPLQSWDLSLQQGLDGADPGTPLLSTYPPTSLLVTNFGATSATLSLLPRPANLPKNHELPHLSELFPQGRGCYQPPGQPASTGLLHLPLSRLLFQLWQCGSAWHGPLLPRVGQGEAWGHRVSLKSSKTSTVATFFSRMCWNLPKMSGVKFRMPWKLPWPWRRTWTRLFWICMTWTLPAQTLFSVTSWRTISWMKRWNSSRRWATTLLKSAGWLAPRLGHVSLRKVHP